MASTDFCVQVKKIKLTAMDQKKKQWSRDKSRKSNFREINDIVHERIQLFHPVQLIIDTPEFQRLRHIKQLGICNLVYPSADHCRFTHSLGVFSLADACVKELAESSPQLNITANDQLCIVIAALVHDLGHGPFSHLYEQFLNVTNPMANFRHETNSTKIFELMLKNNSQLKQALDEYLHEDDYLFIAELIDPPPAPFVSNKHDGLDVDKFDYFLRDSKLGNMPIPFSMTTVGRIRDNCKALFDDQLGYRRLVFAEKNMDEIKDVFESRVKLHDRLYHHKTCIAAEILLIEALRLADPHLKFKTSSQSLLCLSNAILDPTAFIRLDDRIIYQIMMSEAKSMLPAQNILSQLQLRKFPRYVCSILLDNYEHLSTTAEEVKIGVLRQSELLSDSDIIVKVHCIHRGLGAFNSPLASVRFYNRGHQMETLSSKLTSKTWLKYNTLPMGGKGVANIFAPFGANEATLKDLYTAAATYEDLQCSSEVYFLCNASMEENERWSVKAALEKLYLQTDI